MESGDIAFALYNQFVLSKRGIGGKDAAVTGTLEVHL